MFSLDMIQKGMNVLTSDNYRLGAVREVMDHVIFLDEVEADASFRKTSVPLIWIIDIDSSVRLAKSREQVERAWLADPGSSL
jgi:Uncharacterized protein conserved in bacteria (DUF2171)